MKYLADWNLALKRTAYKTAVRPKTVTKRERGNKDDIFFQKTATEPIITPPRDLSQLRHVLLRLLVSRHPPYTLTNLLNLAGNL